LRISARAYRSICEQKIDNFEVAHLLLVHGWLLADTAQYRAALAAVKHVPGSCAEYNKVLFLRSRCLENLGQYSRSARAYWKGSAISITQPSYKYGKVLQIVMSASQFKGSETFSTAKYCAPSVSLGVEKAIFEEHSPERKIKLAEKLVNLAIGHHDYATAIAQCDDFIAQYPGAHALNLRLCKIRIWEALAMGEEAKRELYDFKSACQQLSRL